MRAVSHRMFEMGEEYDVVRDGATVFSGWGLNGHDKVGDYISFHANTPELKVGDRLVGRNNGEEHPVVKIRRDVSGGTLIKISAYVSLKPAQPIPSSTHIGNIQQFHGPVQGSIIAQNSTVSHNNVTSNDPASFAAAVKALGEDLGDVMEDHREAVTDAFALLVRAIEDNTTPRTSQLAGAVEAIGEGSPSRLVSLKTVVEGAAGSLVAEAFKPLLLMEMARLGIGG